MSQCFRMRITCAVRKTDATITLDGVRFQVPQVYAHLEHLTLRYARWDLGEAEILCPETFKPLAAIYPLNKLTNSLGQRNAKELPDEVKAPEETEALLSLSTDTLPPLFALFSTAHSRK